MTTKELFTHITSDKDWHVGYCAESTARVLKHRHEKGKLTPNGYKKLFGHFGYKLTDQWERNQPQ